MALNLNAKRVSILDSIQVEQEGVSQPIDVSDYDSFLVVQKAVGESGDHVVGQPDIKMQGSPDRLVWFDMPYDIKLVDHRDLSDDTSQPFTEDEAAQTVRKFVNNTFKGGTLNQSAATYKHMAFPWVRFSVRKGGLADPGTYPVILGMTMKQRAPAQ